MVHLDERDSITVLFDYRVGDRTLRPFYCCKCGKCVCEVTGEVKMLVPGMPSEEDITALSIKGAHLCRGVIFLANGTKQRCDAKYLF